jgi:hypothetical protein
MWWLRFSFRPFLSTAVYGQAWNRGGVTSVTTGSVSDMRGKTVAGKADHAAAPEDSDALGSFCISRREVNKRQLSSTFDN